MAGIEPAEGGYAGVIAIIGMACRFPRARNVEEFWQNLRNGVEAFSPLSDADLQATGFDEATLNDPRYVKVAPVMEDIECFDAPFFGLIPREAALLDPQQRLFLELAWEVLERAGYNSQLYRGRIGVYAGADANRYFMNNILSHPSLVATLDPYQIMTLTDKDYLCPRTSYHLNLTGPSVSVQSACSTALVAVHMASQSLLNGECDMALAGGVSLRIPQTAGYMPVEGGVLSPDGHCRAYDAGAHGTLFGSGAGVVVLKRLEDALADRDQIHAVIRGSAVNNDGSLRVGFSAPGVDGQVRVITEALAMSGVDPVTINYVEGHGTGTELGDPIEVAALTRAFRAYTQRKQYCALGSVKSNIGHASTAAGIAGLIKTVLALENGEIPSTLHFDQPNPQMDLDSSPFFVNASLQPWPATCGPRRAAVSSFGMGGTNAHLILEQAPRPEPAAPSSGWQMLSLSARTPAGLDAQAANLAAYLEAHPTVNLADVAYTLHVGRHAFEQRLAVVCETADDAARALAERSAARVRTATTPEIEPSVVFMFPGGGAQYANMGARLYREEPVFRSHVDECAALLQPLLGCDIRTWMYPEKECEAEAAAMLQRPAIGLPALFVVSMAQAQLWLTWGIRPAAMIGHSVGEYAVACLAGVFSLKDALAIVALRGRLFEQLPEGAMLNVPLSEGQIQPYLDSDVSVAVVNNPTTCVVSGPCQAIAALEQRLAEDRIPSQLLRISVAAHCKMVDPILAEFTAFVRGIARRAPTIPFVSNVTGRWITTEEATDPAYWARHLRQPVLFSQGLSELFKEPGRILLEVGPGATLGSLARRHPNRPAEQQALSSIRHPEDQKPDTAFLLNTLAGLWLAGVRVDWAAFHAGEKRQRLVLPTYPFARQRCWIEPGEKQAAAAQPLAKIADPLQWFYLPVWKQAALPQPPDSENLPRERRHWLLLLDPCGVGSLLARRLEQMGQEVWTVQAGGQFATLGERTLAIEPQPVDFKRLLAEMAEQGSRPDHVVFLWGVSNADGEQSGRARFRECQRLGLYSLLSLVRALREQNVAFSCHIDVVTNGMQAVTGAEVLYPEKATLLAPCKAVPQESPGITCRSIDIEIPGSGMIGGEALASQLMAELLTPPTDLVLAYRGRRRWVHTFEPLRLPAQVASTKRLRDRGVYMIVGGLGGVGFALAEHLAETVQARLVLCGRSYLPARADWDRWLSEHDDRDGNSRKIRRLRSLEDMGAEVLFVQADVADERQMTEAVALAYKRFGALHGVIHAAGALGQELERAISEIGEVECERQFETKVYGLYVLEKVLARTSLDFCMLMSSISSVLAGLGLCAYAAGNLFMDAFVNAHQQAPTSPWSCVNWDLWRVEEFTERQGDRPLGVTLASLGMTPEEAVETWERAIALKGVPQVVISTGNLQARIDQWVRLNPDAGLEARAWGDSPYQPRPELKDAYVAPATDLERTIAEVWQAVFGIERIGLQDNFFELGGHSLLGVQLISRLRDRLQVELPVRSLFENPTVAGIARVIDELPRAHALDSSRAIHPEDFERGRL